jgi:hypothetical protein
MASHQQSPVVSGGVLGRAIRRMIPRPLHRRWLRWRWLSGPLPGDWWPQFEREFRAYCGASPGRPRRHEPHETDH